MAMHEEHLVCFVDVLGFREALNQGGRADQILELLTTLSGHRGESLVQVNPEPDATVTTGKGLVLQPATSIQLRPAILAFSDNIVISYPLDHLAQQAIPLPVVMSMLQNLVGYIAWNAFNARLLVRGGIAVGQFFHRDGIVFGPPLVEAYQTEQHLAVFPRIVMGPSVLQHAQFPLMAGNYRADDDGVIALDLTYPFLLRFPPFAGPANLMIKDWIEQVKHTIQTETARLTSEQNFRALAKWKWFETKLNEELPRFTQLFLDDDDAGR